ncbi:MAG: sterol desaturase family protein [Gallionellaceae bacterium]
MPYSDISAINIMLIGFAAHFVMFLTRYVLVCGGAVWWIKANEKRLAKRKIQANKASREQMKTEILWSLSTFVVFACTGAIMFYLVSRGHTKMYLEIDAMGWGYFCFSVIASIMIHDAYFYLAHRLMHHPILFKKVHLVHHLSIDPTPWASFAFHPYEAVLEALIIPLIILTLPIHPFAIFIFLTYMVLMNTWGHLGYELLPRAFPRAFPFSLSNTSTHHNMHHSKFNCNYGLYFSGWDKLCGTMSADYLSYFDQVKDKLEQAKYEKAEAMPPLKRWSK